MSWCKESKRCAELLGLFAMAFVLLAAWMPPANAQSLSAEIDAVEERLIDARRYRGNWPGQSNDPRPVRQRFLGLDDLGADCGPKRASAGHALSAVVDELVRLSGRATEQDDHQRIDRLLNQAVQLALQGWVLSGNVSLLEGLRVSYPMGDRGASGPELGANCEQSPYGSLEGEFDFLAVDDATRAGLLYGEGVLLSL